MNTQEIILSLLGVVAGLLFIWITGAGIIPFLKSLTAYTDEKREMARKGIEGVDAYFADHPSTLGNVIHEVSSSVNFSPNDPAIMAMGNVLAKALELTNKILPNTDERLPAEMVSSAANEAAAVIARVTDTIKGNAFADLTEEKPSPKL